MKIIKWIPGVCIVALALFITSCQKDEELSNGDTQSTEKLMSENGNNPDDTMLSEDDPNGRFSLTGYVYIQSNDPSGNSIITYKQNANGQLTYESTTMSGGTGAGSGLGSQGAVILDKHNNWLYTVNAGDNTVSSFRVNNNGMLTLTHTVSSGGDFPVSVTNYHNKLYVLNAGSDNIAGFTVNNGMMTAIPGSMQMLSTTGAGGAQVSFSPNGRYLYVSEKATNMISTYMVNGMGVAQSGTASSSVGQTPFGFEFARNKFMVVSNAAGGAAGAGSTTSYRGILSGNLNAANGAVPNFQAAPCWVAVTKFGRYSYVTNTATDNISSYYVSPTGNLYLAQANITSNDGPIDMSVAGNNLYAYALCAADHTIASYRRTIFGGLTQIGTVQNVPMHAAGMAAF